MATVPEFTPVTTPEVEPTVAIELFALLQVPPTVTLFKAVVKPGHTLVFPVLGPNDKTVTRVFLEHPPPNE
jgi:hypothetical protein